MNTELGARMTAARTVVAGYRAEQARHRMSEPAPGGYHALRLAAELESLLGWLDGVALAEAGAARKLAAILAVFDVFDWRTDDKQYALEQICDVLNGDGQ